jgi:hypothetical protein
MRSLPRTIGHWLAVPVLAVISSSAAMAESPESPGANLLTNGDFTSGTSGWELKSFRKEAQFALDREAVWNGLPSVRLDNLGADYSYVCQKIAVKPGTRYLLSGWVRTRNVVPGAANPKSTAGASLGCLTGRG